MFEESTVSEEVIDNEYSEIKEVGSTVETETESEIETETEPEIETEGDKTREFTFGEDKISLPFDSITDDVANQIQEFSDSIKNNGIESEKQIENTKISLGLREKTLQSFSSINDATLNTYSQGLSLRDEIDQLSKVDLNSLWQSNPDQARQVSDAIGRKQAEFQSVVAQVGEQEQELFLAKEEENNRLRNEGVSILNRKYENFSTEKAPLLIKYVVSQGMNKADAENWALSPLVADMAYKAMLYDDMQSKVKSKPSVKQVVKPIKASKIKGNSKSGVKDLDKMSMDEYAKWRNKK